MTTSRQGSLENELLDLSRLPLKALKKKWAEHCSTPLPKNMSRDFLILRLAWQMQTAAYGHLSSKTRKQLVSLMESLVRLGTVNIDRQVQLKPGTRLIREWKSEHHEVTILETSFAYRGQQYGSLTEIARLITGTHWSGPAFFGLRKRSRRRGAGDA